jgi:uroporphyrinogen decarboxylase
MNKRERVERCMKRQAVDIPAVQYLYTDCGIYEHGEKLNALLEKYPGDFSPFIRVNPPKLGSNAVGADGKYYEVKKDAWGTTFEYKIAGRLGHAIGFPIESASDYAAYTFPCLPSYCTDDEALKAEKARVEEQKKNYFTVSNEWYSILEKLISLRGFENALIDLYEDGPEVNAFLDRLTDYYLHSIRKLIDMGVDCIMFGDDYGTQNSLLISTEIFEKSIAPRLKQLMAPIKEAGRRIYFHSCGLVKDLFSIFEELGVDAIWPQLPVYDMIELARACADHNFSLAIHTDRALTMTLGTPEEVRAMVRKEAEIFKPLEGRSWFYIEVDHGFPYENVEALIDEVFSMRK